MTILEFILNKDLGLGIGFNEIFFFLVNTVTASLTVVMTAVMTVLMTVVTTAMVTIVMTVVMVLFHVQHV